MLDGKDKDTFCNIRLLRDCVKESTKPVVFWIGAGASVWCGYPLWNEFAEKVHSDFLKYEAKYDTDTAINFLKIKNYPSLFSLCKNTNSKRFFSAIGNTFSVKQPSSVYKRFGEILAGIQPCYILTTNVEHCLENNLVGINMVERSDLERCVDLLQKKHSFVCKLHGSVSHIESTVFTKEDYEDILKDKRYLSLIQHIFTECIIVFFGYSLNDQYVIDSLRASASNKQIFGDGPHFAVVHEPSDFSLPENVRLIRYSSEPHCDHRSAIAVLDIIRTAKNYGNIRVSSDMGSQPDTASFTSAYYISDIYPPGTWTTTQSIEATGDGGNNRNIIVGQGFIESEMPSTRYTAMHDLIVALICFDIVYFPLSALSRVHELLGSDFFWSLVKENAIRFIYHCDEPGVIYTSASTYFGGDIGMITAINQEGEPLSILDRIKRQLKPKEGKEKIAEELFKNLETKVEIINKTTGYNAANLTRGALLHPSVKQLLGISDAVLPTSIPRWVLFPVLRLAHVIQVGVVCNHFRIAATKIPFGGEQLANVAFSVAAASDWADENASYVLSGRFCSDLGEFIMKNPEILKIIMKFRDTEDGIRFRKEIMSHLLTNSGSEFVSSVNAGLKHNLPAHVLDKARAQLSGLLLANGRNCLITPAIWNNLSNTDEAINLWRKRSASLLREYCIKNNIGEYDLCPCGSGEKLHFCCEKAFKN